MKRFFSSFRVISSLCLSIITSAVCAQDLCDNDEPICCVEKDLNLNRSEFYLGPDFYYLERNREGGTTQDGGFVGIRGGFDRLKHFGWYWGGEGEYSLGNLSGHDRRGRTLHSRYSQGMVEGRVGYTVQQECGYQCSFTPFVGAGYSVEKNNFKDPSPLPIHFKTRYTYATLGFLTWMHLCEKWELGLNFKAKYPLSPKCQVSNDPLHDPVTQRIGEKFFYRVELPITYRYFDQERFVLRASPYYEYRNYGSHINFPSDFFETKFNIVGVTFEIVYRM